MSTNKSSYLSPEEHVWVQRAMLPTIVGATTSNVSNSQYEKRFVVYLEGKIEDTQKIFEQAFAAVREGFHVTVEIKKC